MCKLNRPWRPAWACALALVVLPGSRAVALINPQFTPQHLEEQAELIFTVKAPAIDADGKGVILTVGEVLKGKLSAGKIRVDLNPILAEKDGRVHADAFLDVLKTAENRPGVVMAGKAAGDAKLMAYFHMEGQWLPFVQGLGPDSWVLEAGTPRQGAFTMNATFNGGSDMLIATLRCIRQSPSSGLMRVNPGVSWADHTRLGRLPGKAAALVAADVNADGRLDLFAACPEGDRIFLQEKAGRFIKEPIEPGSKSLAAAWADFDGDGRPDLASLGGSGLKILLQTGPGTFAVRAVALPAKMEPANGTLAIVDIEPDGRPDLVVGLGEPLVLRNDGKAGFAAAALPGGSSSPIEQGPAGPSVVADFDADGMVDIIQTYAKGGRLWRGKPGGFYEPVECGALAGQAPWRRACVADLDGDGLLDIFLIGGKTTPHLLQNHAGRQFREMFQFCGEPKYKIQTDASCAAFGDFNNDTFVDLFVGGEGEERLFFFNRGFRSLAVDEAQMLDIGEENMPGIEKGAVDAVWADFGATGAQTLALNLPNGDVYLSRTDLGTQPKAPAVRVPFDKTFRSAAPQLVRFSMGGRSLGARVADRWCGPAILGVDDAGAYGVAIKTPEGKDVTRKIIGGDDQ